MSYTRQLKNRNRLIGPSGRCRRRMLAPDHATANKTMSPTGLRITAHIQGSMG